MDAFTVIVILVLALGLGLLLLVVFSPRVEAPPPPKDYLDEKRRLRCWRCRKLIYTSELNAQAAADNAERYNTYLRVYFEPSCGKWHLTSQV